MICIYFLIPCTYLEYRYYISKKRVNNIQAKLTESLYKVIGCVSVCVCTDMVLLYSLAYYLGPGKVLSLLLRNCLTFFRQDLGYFL